VEEEPPNTEVVAVAPVPVTPLVTVCMVQAEVVVVAMPQRTMGEKAEIGDSISMVEDKHTLPPQAPLVMERKTVEVRQPPEATALTGYSGVAKVAAVGATTHQMVMPVQVEMAESLAAQEVAEVPPPTAEVVLGEQAVTELEAK